MAGYPYTWFRSLFVSEKVKENGEAGNLHVRVMKNGDETVRVALPAQSARWLIDLIPADVVRKIREESIPIDDIQKELQENPVLYPRKIFNLKEDHREVDVWLE
ncbi:MAG: hypothetical protein RBT63_06695 [Bdellovibrionales bacterium]|jgi:hypothetical protein|nr:hypothetical protein [Bdellovibrionales bacterium]